MSASPRSASAVVPAGAPRKSMWPSASLPPALTNRCVASAGRGPNCSRTSVVVPPSTARSVAFDPPGSRRRSCRTTSGAPPVYAALSKIESPRRTTWFMLQSPHCDREQNRPLLCEQATQRSRAAGRTRPVEGGDGVGGRVGCDLAVCHIAGVVDHRVAGGNGDDGVELVIPDVVDLVLRKVVRLRHGGCTSLVLSLLSRTVLSQQHAAYSS